MCALSKRQQTLQCCCFLEVQENGASLFKKNPTEKALQVRSRFKLTFAFTPQSQCIQETWEDIGYQQAFFSEPLTVCNKA